MKLSERTVDFLFNLHPMSKDGRKEYACNILNMDAYKDTIDELCSAFGTESPEEFVYNIVEETYYNAI
jgi:hypothetical protein